MEYEAVRSLLTAVVHRHIPAFDQYTPGYPICGMELCTMQCDMVLRMGGRGEGPGSGSGSDATDSGYNSTFDGTVHGLPPTGAVKQETARRDGLRSTVPAAPAAPEQSVLSRESQQLPEMFSDVSLAQPQRQQPQQQRASNPFTTGRQWDGIARWTGSPRTLSPVPTDEAASIAEWPGGAEGDGGPSMSVGQTGDGRGGTSTRFSQAFMGAPGIGSGGDGCRLSSDSMNGTLASKAIMGLYLPSGTPERIGPGVTQSTSENYSRRLVGGENNSPAGRHFVEERAGGARGRYASGMNPETWPPAHLPVGSPAGLTEPKGVRGSNEFVDQSRNQQPLGVLPSWNDIGGRVGAGVAPSAGRRVQGAAGGFGTGSISDGGGGLQAPARRRHLGGHRQQYAGAGHRHSNGVSVGVADMRGGVGGGGPIKLEGTTVGVGGAPLLQNGASTAAAAAGGKDSSSNSMWSAPCTKEIQDLASVVEGLTPKSNPHAHNVGSHHSRSRSQPDALQAAVTMLPMDLAHRDGGGTKRALLDTEGSSEAGGATAWGAHMSPQGGGDPSAAGAGGAICSSGSSTNMLPNLSVSTAIANGGGGGGGRMLSSTGVTSLSSTAGVAAADRQWGPCRPSGCTPSMGVAPMCTPSGCTPSRCAPSMGAAPMCTAGGCTPTSAVDGSSKRQADCKGGGRRCGDGGAGGREQGGVVVTATGASRRQARGGEGDLDFASDLGMLLEVDELSDSMWHEEGGPH